MIKLKNFDEISQKPKAVTIGNFDGVHKGHRALIEHTIKTAKSNDMDSVVLTFDAFPNEIFQKQGFQRLYSNEYKESLIELLNLDILLSLDFNLLKDFTAERFCKEVLIQRLNTKYLIVGKDFKFGKNKLGDIDYLKEYDKEKYFDLIIPKHESYKKKIISSSRIRQYLNNGKFIDANECLGREYMISGIVTSGEKLGRELGYPTANISLKHDYPLDGVYLSRVIIDREVFTGLASVGNKPTFQGQEKLLEVYILDFNQNIYEKYIEVYFLEEIRKQIKFNNEDELIKQMNEDHKYAIIKSKKNGI